ncbi:MAG: heterodisulfide reductase-related iron-sulfur binding cluster [Candidatus Methylomirabilia bacterium]
MRQEKAVPTEGIYIFKSCQISAEYPGVESSTLYAFDKLGVKYFNDPMQCCCSGMGYYSDLFSYLTVVGLAARNCALAVRSNHPNIAVFCSTCYAVNKKCTEILRENRAVYDRVNEILAGIGLHYGNELDVRAHHFSTVEILWKLRKAIRELAVVDLGGLTVAAHPACHYCKVFYEDVLTDPAFPTIQDEIAEELGARSIRRFQEKLLTCGAGFRQRFTNKAVSLAITNAKLAELQKAGVEVLLHMCPNCHVQYDRYQPLLSQAVRITYTMVHLHIQQLVALALGAHPYNVVGLQTHSVPVEPLLRKLGIEVPKEELTCKSSS